MKKIFIILSVIPVVWVIAGNGFASRVAFDTTGTCQVEGIIQSVEFKEAFDDPCVAQQDCPVGAFVPERPAMFFLTVSLESISCIPEGKDDPFSYRAQFRLEDDNLFAVHQSIVEEGDVFAPGDKISGKVEFITLQNTLTSYALRKARGKKQGEAQFLP